MLPLWIIDLREKSDRRDFFESLIGQIDHVYKSTTNDAETDAEANAAASTSSERGDSHNLSEVEGIETTSSPTPSWTSPTEPDFVSIERHEAEKSSHIEGNYWCYSCMADFFYGISISDQSNDAKSLHDEKHQYFEIDENPTVESTAERLYKFQSELVKEGQKFIHQLRTSNAHPDIKINIVVLGDITEDFTRILFPSIAGIQQKEKGRILPHHIHQGMEIIGMLYVPCDINTFEASTRRSMQRTLKEIDVQYRVTDIRGYDHMMLYQDVQNRTECVYPIMNDQQLAEYLMQCIVHLFLACTETHPLLSGTTSADAFYFSMGATSVFFDTESEDMKSRQKMVVEVIRNFKNDGDDEKEHQNLQVIDDNDYNPESFVNVESLRNLSFEEIDEDDPNPHPVRNFLSKFLKRNYYNLYLRFFTKNLMQSIINQIDRSTSASLENISTDCKRKFKDAQTSINAKLLDILGKISANDGGIPAIIRTFKAMQVQMSDKKKEIQKYLEQKYWRKIEEDSIPKRLIDSFIEYHDAYQDDIRRKGSNEQLKRKEEATTELNQLLSKEATILSRICRSVLLGIMCALAIVPILNLLSPQVIDLGRVRRYGEWWSLGIFFIPALIQILSYWRYTRKKKRYVNNLKAMYLHDAYSRVANRIETEINSFYDKLIALGGKYIDRCEDIQKQLGKDLGTEIQSKPLFAESTFNQPLIGGKFGAFNLLPESEAGDLEVRINYIKYKFSDITKVEYFLFINQNKGIFRDLFLDVRLCENLIRRVKDDGDEELVTKEQQERELQDAWDHHRRQFNIDLREAVKDALMPRMESTVGEKLHHYCKNAPENIDVLKPMVEYAATNGELTSSADLEYADAKTSEKVASQYVLPYISTVRKQIQADKYDKMYGKYIFLSRWRCFNHFNFNRILPSEDFDEKIRRQRVWEAEQKHKAEEAKKKKLQPEEAEKQGLQPEESMEQEHQVEGAVKQASKYERRISSLLLWSLCPDDSSSEWFRLFDSEFFANAFNDKNIIRETLNQDD